MNSRLQLHHIQRSILLSLAITSPRKFSELQPPRVTNNVFSYHLKRLVDAGYITSTPLGYIPERKALKAMALPASGSHKMPSPVPLTMLYVVNSQKEVLLINRNTSPFRGWYGLPSGLIHVGESSDIAAKRELKEKTTLDMDVSSLRLAGVLDFQYIQDATKDVFVHAIAFIYTATLPTAGASLHDKESGYGQLSWSKFGRLHILPEVEAVREIVEGGVFTHKAITLREPHHEITRP